jgi:hypothetical protein
VSSLPLTRVTAFPALALTLTLSACGGSGDAGSAAVSPTPPRSVTADVTTPPGSPTSTPSVPAPTVIVVVSDGQVTPKPGPVEVKLGQRVIIDVTSDAADEVHVHGYDRTLELSPGKPGRIEFTASIPGAFEVEHEEAHKELFELRVR